MKEIFQQIVDICEKHKDEEGTLNEIRVKAKNRVIRYEWEEKYGIKLGSNCRFSEYCLLYTSDAADEAYDV